MRCMKPLLLGGEAQTYLGLAPLATLIKWEQLLGKEKDVSLTPLVGHEHDPPSGTLWKVFTRKAALDLAIPHEITLEK